MKVSDLVKKVGKLGGDMNDKKSAEDMEFFCAFWRGNELYPRFLRSWSYTHPVGFGNPAILQAPLPGPEGNNS